MTEDIKCAKFSPEVYEFCVSIIVADGTKLFTAYITCAKL